MASAPSYPGHDERAAVAAIAAHTDGEAYSGGPLEFETRACARVVTGKRSKQHRAIIGPCRRDPDTLTRGQVRTIVMNAMT